eukprot:scaffold15538_cov88-Attheya_sp.AAC.3
MTDGPTMESGTFLVKLYQKATSQTLSSTNHRLAYHTGRIMFCGRIDSICHQMFLKLTSISTYGAYVSFQDDTSGSRCQNIAVSQL